MSRRAPRRQVLALAILLLACTGLGARGTSDTVGDALPGAPEGTRWVGMGRVVVAVPDWWTVGETRCGAPVEDTVYFDSGAQTDCADPPPPSLVQEVSSLAVLDGTRGYAEYAVRAMRPVAETAGVEVVERAGCVPWFEGLCRRMFAVPSEGVVLAVSISDDDGDPREREEMYERIRDSVRVLPASLTTVPLATSDGWTPSWGAEPTVLAALRRSLRAAGLLVQVVTPPDRDSTSTGGLDAGLPAGSLLDVTPSLGSVVEVGATVTITVAGPPRFAQ